MFNMAIVINIMRSLHTSSRLMMWWSCRQEVGRSVGEAAAEWRPPTRLMCLCSKRWEDPTAISGRTFISVGRSSQAELRFKWSSVVFFFFPPFSFFFPFRVWIHPPVLRQQYNAGGASSPGAVFPPEQSRLLYVSIMCLIPRGSSGDNRGDLLCSMRCRPWALKQKGQTQSGALLHQAPRIKWEKKTQSLDLNVFFFP